MTNRRNGGGLGEETLGSNSQDPSVTEWMPEGFPLLIDEEVGLHSGEFPQDVILPLTALESAAGLPIQGPRIDPEGTSPDPRAVPDKRSGLAGKVRSAVIWNVGFNLFRDLAQFVTMLVLVRLLAPVNYGEFGMTTSIIGFFSVFGFGVFIGHSLQVQEDDQTRYQEHFTVGGVLQGALFLLTNLFATALWWIPRFSSVALFVHVMSITFLLEWPCELRLKMLERQLNWKRRRLLHAGGIVGGSVVAVLLAVTGFGTYALLLPGLLVTLPFIYDLFIVERWRPTWEWSWRTYRPAFQFGLTRLGSGVSTRGRTLLESAVLAAVLGFSGLGIFSRAIGLAQMFCSKFGSQLLYAIYPLLTRVEKFGGDRVRTGNVVLRFVAWTSIPVATILAILAGPTVHILYGNKWDGVMPLLPWALAVAVLVSLLNTGNNLLLAHQRAGRCLAMDVTYLVVTGAALLVSVIKGPVAYLMTLVVLVTLQLGVLLSWLCRYKTLSWWGAAQALLPPVIASGAAGAILALIPWAAPFRLDVRAIIRLMLSAALFGTLYLTGIRLLFRKGLESLIHVFPARRIIRRMLFLPAEE